MESITIDNGVEEVELQLTRTSIMMLFRTRNVPIKSFRSVAAQLGIENMEEAPAGAIGAAFAEHFNKEAAAAAVESANKQHQWFLTVMLPYHSPSSRSRAGQLHHSYISSAR